MRHNKSRVVHNSPEDGSPKDEGKVKGDQTNSAEANALACSEGRRLAKVGAVGTL